MKSFQGLIDDGKRLELVEADLLKPETWPAAVEGCTYVCHVASPFVFGVSKDEEDTLIKPAVDGTLNVLRPSKANKVNDFALSCTHPQTILVPLGCKLVNHMPQAIAVHSSILGTIGPFRVVKLREKKSESSFSKRTFNNIKSF